MGVAGTRISNKKVFFAWKTNEDMCKLTSIDLKVMWTLGYDDS